MHNGEANEILFRYGREEPAAAGDPVFNRGGEGLAQRRALEKIKVAVAFMEEHLMEPMQVRALAGLAGMSEAHFFYLFKRATGRTPIGYFIALRMKRACCLLKDTTLLVKQVASLVGYDDKEYFCRTFKMVNGVTASEYREKVTRPANWNETRGERDVEFAEYPA